MVKNLITESGLESNSKRSNHCTCPTDPRQSRSPPAHQATAACRGRVRQSTTTWYSGLLSAASLSLLPLMSTLPPSSSQAHKAQVTDKPGLLFACTLLYGLACVCTSPLCVSQCVLLLIDIKKEKKRMMFEVSARLCSANITKLVQWI